MAQQIFVNNYLSALSNDISTGTTVITVDSLVNFPTSIPAGDFVKVTLKRASDGAVEICRATNVNVGASQITVVRGQELTAPLAFKAGDRISGNLTAEFLNETEEFIENFNTAASEVLAAADDAQAAANSAEQFNAKYLGAQASDPTVDNNGNPVVAGAVYLNTGVPELRYYDGAAWGNVTSDTAAAILAKLLTVDGAGSGVDADFLDGLDSLQFLRSDVDDTFSGNLGITGNLDVQGYISGPAVFTIDPSAIGDNTGKVVIAGDLQVDGTTTTVNSTTLEVTDLNITVAKDATIPSEANGAGLTVAGANATITYDSATDSWKFNKVIKDSSGNNYANLALNETVTGLWTFTGGITSNGNVGIGTTSPGQKLVVENSINILSTDVGTNAKGNILLSNIGGTPGDGNLGAGIAFTGINTSRRRALISTYQDGADGDPTGLAFFTYPFTTTGSDLVNERMRITSDGKVGINSTSPRGLLHVLDGRLEVENSGLGSSTIADAKTKGILLTAGGMNTTSQYTAPLMFGSHDPDLGASDGPLCYIAGKAEQSFTSSTSTGMGIEFFVNPVGSGLSPISSLILKNDGVAGFISGSAASPSVTFQGDFDTGIFSPTSNTIAFSTGGTERARIDSTGNVGIGTVSPGEKLEVNGNVKAADFITANSNSVLSNFAGLSRGYLRNVSNLPSSSNPDNTTTTTAGVDATMQLNGDGTNNVTWSTVTTGKLEFDATFNSNNGGLILDQLNGETELKFRITFQQLTAGTSTVTARVFLVFDKTVPGTGVTINAAPVDCTQNAERAVELSAFHGGIEACYVQINSDAAKDYQLNGFKVHALEQIPALT